jgi:hypothetical protein
MKTLTKFAVILFTTFALAGNLYARHADDFSKTVTREFPVAKDARFVIENKYGDIQCNNWDKESISIVVKISVQARNQEVADAFFKKININLSGTTSLVEAKTVITEGLRTNGSFSIDYTINMPAWINLEATNKFGNLYVNELTGKAKIEIGYGNAEIQKLDNSDNLLDIKFGNANIDWIKGAVLNMKYSNFEGTYAGSLKMNSKYSNFNGKQVIALDMLFEGGKLELENSSVVTCKSKFADISINKVEQKIDLDNQYGSFSVDEINPEFSGIVVVNSYGNIDLGVPGTSAYMLDAEMHYCNLEYNDSKINVDYRNDSGHDLVVKGTIGQNPKASVKVTSNYGNVSLEN